MELAELFNEIYYMPDSQARVDALKEAIRLADQEGDAKYGFRFREELISNASIYGIYADVRDALVAFGWILGHIDKHGFASVYDVHDMLDQYQWICCKIGIYPEISLAQIHSLFYDFKQRLSAAGYSLRAYHEVQIHQGMVLDDIKMATEGFRGYFGGKKDSIVRCDACIDGVYVKYHVFTGDHDGAMLAARDLINGKKSCNANPRAAFNNLLLSALEHNIAGEEIEKIRQRAYTRIKDDPFFMDFIGWHLIYLARTDAAKGLNMYKKHLPWSFSSHRTPLNHYAFNIGAAVLLKTLAAKRQSFKANISEKFPLYNPGDTYNFDELARHHYELAKDIAAQYDARNGTAGYTDRLERFMS